MVCGIHLKFDSSKSNAFLIEVLWLNVDSTHQWSHRPFTQRSSLSYANNLFVKSNLLHCNFTEDITHLSIHQIIFISGRSSFFYPTCVNLWSVWYRKEKQILTTFATGVIIFKIILKIIRSLFRAWLCRCYISYRIV